MGALSLTGKPAIRQPFQPFGVDVRFVPYGDAAALAAAVGPDCAAVFLEPCLGEGGIVPAPPGYLRAARAACDESGALLILDEVVTGFRYAPGGCQEYYGIQPDISTFGKALGAGFPVGAVAGPRTILDRMRWSENMVLHYGTFNGHRLTMKVIAANLDLLSAGGTYRNLHAVVASRQDIRAA